MHGRTGQDVTSQDTKRRLAGAFHAAPSPRGRMRSLPRAACFLSAHCFSADKVSKYSAPTTSEPGTCGRR